MVVWLSLSSFTPEVLITLCIHLHPNGLSFLCVKFHWNVKFINVGGYQEGLQVPDKAATLKHIQWLLGHRNTEQQRLLTIEEKILKKL